MNQASSESRGWPRTASETALLAAAVALCAWWSITYTRGPAGVSTLWAASGLLCGILVTSPRSRWPVDIAVALLASFFVNLWHGSVAVRPRTPPCMRPRRRGAIRIALPASAIRFQVGERKQVLTAVTA